MTTAYRDGRVVEHVFEPNKKFKFNRMTTTFDNDGHKGVRVVKTTTTESAKVVKKTATRCVFKEHKFDSVIENKIKMKDFDNLKQEDYAEGGVI